MTLFDRFYRIIRRIPKGKVATYGQIARLAGLPRHARHVGFALSALQDDRVPWHRVINSEGTISRRALPQFEENQRQRLVKEGIRFQHGRVSLRRYQWMPR